MSINEKYYWLKLKDDFFNNKEIKKLRRIAGGDTYIIIYLKMQLLSIKQGGIIKFDQTEENLGEQLSLEIDEGVDNIMMVLSFMKSNNLIEDLTGNEYMLTKVPRLIGKETDAAERMRNMRERNNVTVGENRDVTMLHSNLTELNTQKKRNNVTPMLQDVTQRKEIEIREKKKEIKIDYTTTDSIIDYFNEKTGKNLRHKDVSRKPIKARLNENFTFEECKQVIDIKYDEWIDDENMAKFIRISTFFGNKFEIYLNQQVEEKLSASAREMMKRAFSGASL